MSTWRRKALELFPDLRNEIQHGEATIYTVFFVLRPRCHRAHLSHDVAELQKIYDYAEWCFRQKTKYLWNAAGVAFYEHLGDEAATRDEMHIWLKRDIFDDVAGLLEYMMKQDDFAKVRAQFYPPSRKHRT